MAKKEPEDSKTTTDEDPPQDEDTNEAAPEVITHQEGEPIYDPVNTEAYPERSDAQAQAGVMSINPHDAENRAATLQLVQDPDTGEIRRKDDGPEGPIVNTDYVETKTTVDGEPVGYIAPVY